MKKIVLVLFVSLFLYGCTVGVGGYVYDPYPYYYGYNYGGPFYPYYGYGPFYPYYDYGSYSVHHHHRYRR
jgi:hypothetical protein